MGLFSTPKCPIHRKRYSIGTDGLKNYYFCDECSEEKMYKEREKEQKDKEIRDLKRRLESLENNVKV